MGMLTSKNPLQHLGGALLKRSSSNFFERDKNPASRAKHLSQEGEYYWMAQ